MLAEPANAYAVVALAVVWISIGAGVYLLLRFIRAVGREDPNFPFGL